MVALVILIVKVAQSCRLCDPRIVPGILQARTLEWVAFPFSSGSLIMCQLGLAEPSSPEFLSDAFPLERRAPQRDRGSGSGGAVLRGTSRPALHACSEAALPPDSASASLSPVPESCVSVSSLLAMFLLGD